MKKPRMILFDYGQTLVTEDKFDGVRGTEAVLKYTVENKYHRTAEEIQEEAQVINKELNRFDPQTTHLMQVEVPNFMFTNFLYESQGIKLSISGSQIDRVFWDAAAPGHPTDGIKEFLTFLEKEGVRTGVISNICFEPEVVKERIRNMFPDHDFEFIMPSSEYMYRKPNKRIFSLALEKAGLKADEVWFVGDQYQCDIAGSKEAGIFPVWYLGAIDVPYTQDDSVFTVISWKELQDKMNVSILPT
ncbi:MAG TPA: HAD family hydrolase [Lachnospiraceae bacterium]|nr:HAD family hydrolase [Lachnospiraceae bacterium]